MPLSKSRPDQPPSVDRPTGRPLVQPARPPGPESVAIPATTSTSDATATATSDADLLARRLVPLRRPGRWICAAIAAVLLAMLVHTVLANPRFEWHIVGQYFATASIIHGLELTLWLTAAVMACGYALGIGLACMRLSGNPILRGFAFSYVWLFRSVPVLVQLLFWYELASFFPTLSVGIPFGPAFATANTAHLFSGVFAAFVALSLDVAAFSAEIVRGGILAVDPGQSEAAQALGLGRWRIFRRVVLPQAMPAIVPASGNMLIGTLKSTSLVSVIAVVDLLYAAQLIYNGNFQVIPLLLVVTIWYTLITTVLSVGQYYVERYYARGTKRRPPARTLRQITRANLPLFPQGAGGSVGSIGGL